MKQLAAIAKHLRPRHGLTLALALFSATTAVHAQTVTLTKEFLADPLPGETVQVRYTATNLTNNFVLSLAFTDDFGSVVPGLTVIGTPAGTACGTITGSSIMSVSGGFVGPMSSCTFDATLSVPFAASAGTFPSATGLVTGNELGVGTFSDPGATANLTIIPIVSFEKSFVDDPVQPGGNAILEFSLTNNSPATAVTDLTFTDDLDSTLTGLVATGLPITGVCGIGQISGTSSLSFTNGRLAPAESCTFQVQLLVPLTAATGSHTNTTSGISGNIGGSPFTSGTAVDELKVGLPVLTKTFIDDPVFPGDTVTLEFTIANPSGADTFTDIGFTDDLDAALSGLVVNTLPAPGFCGAGSTLTGTSVLTMATGSLAPLASCTFSVVLDVPNDASASLHLNTTSSLFATTAMTMYEGEPASDELEVIGVPTLTKSFVGDPVAPGEQVTLRFTIDNLNRVDGATSITFTDDLDAALSGLAAVGLPLADPCGTGSMLADTSLLTLSGGTLGAASSCTFDVTLDVPTTATAGSYLNTTSAITSVVGATPVTAGTASDSLIIEPATLISIDWSDDPVVGGATATMDITLTNSSPTSAASGIGFSLPFHPGLPTVSSGPTTTCDGNVAFSPLINPPPPADVILAQLNYGNITPGTLAPGASCTVQIVLNVASDLATGIYPHESTGVTSTVDGVTYVGPPGTDDLIVVAGPQLVKEFTDDPVPPGGTVNLRFTLTHESQAATNATNISFTDDLSAVLMDLAATGLPLVDPCGAGSSLTASAMDTLLTFSGGTLAPGATCTFDVALSVPVAAAPGSHGNTTSGVTATVSGLTTTSLPASDDLQVAGLVFTKEFLDDPVIAGGQVTLRFTVQNNSPNATDDASGIFFTDSLSTALAGLTVNPANLPPAVDTCGGTLSGTSFLIYVGGSLAIGSTCTIEVLVDVPAGAADNDYTNITSSLTATVDGSTVTIDPAIDTLSVSSSLLQLSKSFTDDPVAPGNSVTLELSLTNLDAGQAASDIAFTDDLASALSGLTFDSVLANDCGATIMGTGTSLVTVSNGALTAGGSCTIQLQLSVPGAAAPGLYVNTTSAVTGMIGGLGVNGPAADDTLEVVQLLLFSKSFDGPSTATGEAILTFTITNPGPNIASDLSFSDNLDDVISGLIATSLPTAPCGASSSITGSSFLAFTGGELPPLGGMCSFAVTVQLPATATAGTYPNTTSSLSQAGLLVSDPATADLIVEPPPTFAKVFMPDAILASGVTTLRFTIDNSGSSLAATSLAFIDTFPAGVFVTSPSVTTNTCVGTLSAVAGSGTISLTGGSVAAGTTCTIDVDLTSIVPGMHVNTTGGLSSSSGNSGIATDTLTVIAAADIAVTKTDGVTSASPGTSVAYTIVVTNVGPTSDPAVALSDSFPSPPLTCTYTSVAAGGATGNTAAGAGDLAETLSMPAGSSVTYTASCAIDANATGTLSNTATVTSSVTDPVPGNNSATDNDTVLIPEADLAITKTDGVTSAVPGQSTLVYTIVASNAGPSDDPSVSVTDTFPADLTCSFTSVAAGGASGNTAAGAGDLAETLSMPTGSSVTYTVTCAIDANATGTLSNTATVTSSVTDPVPGNNSATDNDTILMPEADLAITKTDGVTSAVPGQSTLVYTIVASNAGPSDDPSVSVTDTFPVDLTCSFTSVAAGGATGNTAAGSGDLAETLSMPAGSSVTYTVTCAIDANATGTLSNTATVTSSVTDPVPGNNSATDDDTVLMPEADLAITKTDGVTSAVPGQALVYTIVASNAGPSSDPSVSVTDTFPVDLTCTFTSVAAGGATGNTAAGAGDLAETLSMPAGSSVTYTVTCAIDANATGTLSNTATVTSSVTDPVPGNNSATDNDTVLMPEADLAITKTDGLTSAAPGQVLVYTIVASNAGPSSAPSVSVTDTLPVDLTCTFTSVAAGGATGNTAAGAGDLAETLSMPAGSSVTYTLTCAIDANATGTLSNTATVTSSVTDPVPGNNSATDNDTVLMPEADLSITKTDGVTSVAPGQVLDYTITVSNIGPSDAPGTVVADTFPTELLGVTWTCTASVGSTCTAAGSGDIADTVDLAVGGSVVYTATGTIDASFSGVLDNTATVTAAGGVNDPDLANNSASDTTMVTSPAEIFGTKEFFGEPVPGGPIVYTIVLFNGLATAQLDDPLNDEFTDILPPQLNLVQAVADSGVVTSNGNTVFWNGTIPGNGMVEITIDAQILDSAVGEQVSNQGEIFFDSDGDGTNDTLVLTDDPTVPGGDNATTFQVDAIIAIPTLDNLGLFVLAALMALMALRRVGRRSGF